MKNNFKHLKMLCFSVDVDENKVQHKHTLKLLVSKPLVGNLSDSKCKRENDLQFITTVWEVLQ
jgi:hypothetical protein